MTKTLLYLVAFLICGSTYAQQSPFIPLPNKIASLEGTFVLNDHTPLIIEEPSFTAQAHFLQQALLKSVNLNISVQTRAARPAIVLSKMPGKKNQPGEYSLMVTETEIRLSAASNEGMFYGINSLLQLIQQAPENNGSLLLSCWEIKDYPKYAWRGIMLDESRQFFGKSTVKFILDWMAFYKLNKFHWHLTDDPGWRMEIRKYPRLALIGGIGNYSDSLAPAKYYTQEDIKEIITYAAERFIEVIPEVDMPGHAASANKAYPEFSGGGSEKYPEFTFNPGKEGTYQYLTDILKETNSLFPSEMIHLGGDEVHFGNQKWNTDPHIKALMKRQNLPDLKSVEQYFMERMADSVRKMNNKVLLWDEAAGSRLSPDNTIVFWWRHDRPDQLKLALSKGFSVVLIPRLPMYFDFVQDTVQRIGRRWKGDGYNPLDTVYEFDPSEFHSAEQAPLILGIQAAIWTDRISTDSKLQYMLFPRIGALAEAAWTLEANKNYPDFTERIKGHIELYREDKLYFYNPFDPNENPEPLVPGFANPSG